jgi:WXXGXW repeat (2 copies)
MKKFLFTLTCALFLTAGIAQAQVVVRIGPPERPHEVIPPPPPEHRAWAWHAGYHRWDGNRYVWVPGYYVEPPHPLARWVEGHWAHRDGGWVWIEGHWR